MKIPKTLLASCNKGDMLSVLYHIAKGARIYARMSGQFFERRRRLFEKIQLYPKVRLIMTEFDADLEKSRLPEILQKINTGMGWKEEGGDLIAIDRPQNITMQFLLKGIR